MRTVALPDVSGPLVVRGERESDRCGRDLPREAADELMGASSQAPASRRVRAISSAADAPWAASSASPPLSSQHSSTAGVSSGWNCTASERPTVNAWSASADLAMTGTPAGGVNRSECHWNHGPRVDQGWDVRINDSPADLRLRRARHRPPTAAASIWPPKQIPSTGTPSRMACRVKAISSPIQVPIAASSYTDHTAPNGTTAS